MLPNRQEKCPGDAAGGGVPGEEKIVTPSIAARRSASSDDPATRSDLSQEKFVQLPKRIMRRRGSSPTAKLVFAVIVDRIGANGSAWPGYSRIAADTGLHLSTVKRAVKGLIEAGLLRKFPRGRGLSNMYTIPNSSSSSGLNSVQAEPGADCDSGSVQAAPRVVAGCDYRELTHELDPLNETHKRSKKKSPQFSNAECERIYQAYPRKVGKAAALKAIDKALRVIANRGTPDPTVWLLDRVQKYARSAAGQQGKYTPYPAKWINQGRYDDDADEWKNSNGNDRKSREFPEPPKAARRL